MIGKIGDIIEWSFPENHQWQRVAGKTFRAEIAMISKIDCEYGVYAEYGQDLIPFNACKVAISKQP